MRLLAATASSKRPNTVTGNMPYEYLWTCFCFSADLSDWLELAFTSNKFSSELSFDHTFPSSLPYARSFVEYLLVRCAPERAVALEALTPGVSPFVVSHACEIKFAACSSHFEGWDFVRNSS